MYIELYLSLSPEKLKHWSFLSWQRTRWWLHTTSRLHSNLLLIFSWSGEEGGRGSGRGKLEVENWKWKGGSEREGWKGGSEREGWRVEVKKGGWEGKVEIGRGKEREGEGGGGGGVGSRMELDEGDWEEGGRRVGKRH